MAFRARATRRTFFGFPLAAISGGAALAQPTGPFRPARMIVPTPAGSAPDVAARLLAEGLSRRRSHPITVENRPGADGVLGAEAFAQAALLHVTNQAVVFMEFFMAFTTFMLLGTQREVPQFHLYYIFRY